MLENVTSADHLHVFREPGHGTGDRIGVLVLTVAFQIPRGHTREQAWFGSIGRAAPPRAALRWPRPLQHPLPHAP